MVTVPVKMSILLLISKNSSKIEIKLFQGCEISPKSWSWSQLIRKLLSLESFFDSDYLQNSLNLTYFTMLVTLRPFIPFQPKIKAIKL